MSETERTGRQPAATGRHLAPPKPRSGPPGSSLTGRRLRLQTSELEALRQEQDAAREALRRTAAQSAVPEAAEEAEAPEETAEERELRRARRRKKRRLYFGVLLAAFVLIVAAAIVMRAAADHRRYDETYAQAVESYRAGDYDGALSILRRAAALKETDECLRLMADCYEAQGNYERALELMRKLDLSNEANQRRIAALEAARALAQRSELITVNGRDYSPDTRSLVIRDEQTGPELLKEVTQLYALSSLTLTGLGLRDISPLSSLEGLTSLDLSRNELRDLQPLAALSQLRSLYLDGNPTITDFSPLYGLSALTTLSIRDIPVTKAQLEALTKALPGCAIHSEDAEEENAPEITLGGSSFSADVTELDLSGCGLSDISALSACRELKRLNLSDNELSDLSALTDLPKLEELDLSGNLVTDLRPLMSLKALRLIRAEDNDIASTVPLGALTELRELHLARNPLRDLSGLSRLTRLETLGLEDSGLRDEDLESLYSLTGLKVLQITDNSELSGEAVDLLKNTLASCFVQHSPLVYSVTVGREHVRRDVTELDLSGQSLGIIGNLNLLTQLRTLRLRGCELNSLEGLQALIELRELDLSFNNLTDLTQLPHLRALEKLDLSHNQLQSVRVLQNMTWLMELDLSGNELPPEEITELREALPNCTIVFEP